MKNVIAYSLFRNNKNEVNRFWDPDQDKGFDRYLWNIDAILLVNKIVYPDFETRIYIPYYLKIPDRFSMLKCFVKVDILTEYINKEPMLFRLLPLWEKDINYLFCRDIDSLPNEQEIRAGYLFMQSKAIAQGIRSHKYHGGLDHSLLGGLSAYNVPLLREKGFLNNTFLDLLYKAKNIDPEMKWHIDLDTITGFFLSQREFSEQILQTNFNDSPLELGLNRIRYPQEDYDNIDLSFINPELLSLLNEITEWCGQPVDCRLFIDRIIKLC